MEFCILSTRRHECCCGIREAQRRKGVWDEREARDRSLRARTEKVLFQDRRPLDVIHYATFMGTNNQIPELT